MTVGIYYKLGTKFPYEVSTNCCYFYVDPKSKMATMAFDWLTHFRLLKNCFRDLGTNVPSLNLHILPQKTVTQYKFTIIHLIDLSARLALYTKQ